MIVLYAKLNAGEVCIDLISKWGLRMSAVSPVTHVSNASIWSKTNEEDLWRDCEEEMDLCRITSVERKCNKTLASDGIGVSSSSKVAHLCVE
jgi:hypothetical protein